MEDGKKQILLVEDETIIAMMEKQQLEIYGYSVSHVMSGEDAVKKALSVDTAYDVILMDIDLGSGIDGTQAAFEILKAKDIPIVFVSSHVEPEVVKKTENITSYGYIVKNSGIVILDASIKMALRLFDEKMERKRAEKQVLQLKNLYVALSQINQTIMRVGSLEDLAGEVSRVAVQFGPFEFAWVGRHDERTKVVTPIAHAGEPGFIVNGIVHSSDATAEHPCLCGKAIRENRFCVINDLSEADETKDVQSDMVKAGIKAAAVFPVRVKGEVWGVFGVYADEADIFQDKETTLLEEAAMDIGFAVENLENVARRKEGEKFHRLSAAVLSVLNEPLTLHETSKAILRLIKEEFDLDAVGIRLKDEEDFPYFSEEGFEKDFLLTENSLILRSETGTVCRDPDGRICLECTCGLVLAEKCGPPSENVTQTGSLWTNDSLTTAKALHGNDPRLKPRDRCSHDGYMSIALIPIRVDEKIIGLLHLNDRRKNRFTPGAIRFFEGLTASFGIAVERKRTEEGLRESEARYRLIAENAADVIWVLDPVAGRFTYVSPSVEKLRGYTPEEVLAQPASESLSSESAELVTRMLSTYLPAFIARGQGTMSFISEVNQPCKDGSVVRTEVTTNYLFNAQGKVEIVGVSRDISERKEAEEEIKRQLVEKELVLKEVHHRIKNNIASIEGLLSMQAGSTDNDDVKLALQESIARVQSSRILYEKLLLSKDHHVVSTKTYIYSLIDSLVAVFPNRKNVSVELDIADISLGSNIMITVGIIINELITNIYKYAFTGRDGGHISIELTDTENALTLTIKDDGIGIAGRSDAADSAGFGLTLVTMLAKQLKGTFTLENDNGTQAVLRIETD